MLQRAMDFAELALGGRPGPAVSGTTPHRVIHRQGPSRLLYFPAAEPTRAPVFISMPLINTWTIWDLLPERSAVGGLVRAGVPVYLLDWGRPGPEDGALSLVELVDGRLGRALDRARRHAGVEALDVVGYCVGGTFLALHLALNPEAARRVALVCTPIDFHASGRLALWANPETFPLDAIVDGLANFPPELMRTSFAWLRPESQSQKWSTLWERIEDPEFRRLWLALERWNEDNVRFPGEVYREYVRSCYFENRLIAGGWSLGGQAVDLGRVKLPALSLAAEQDHIVPPPAAHALEQVWGGPVQTRTLRGGHVGISLKRSLVDALLEWFEA